MVIKINNGLSYQHIKLIKKRVYLFVNEIENIFRKNLEQNLSKMCLDTSESTAERGSSIRIRSALEYTALARLIRDLCPPDNDIPLSPTIVDTPEGINSISLIMVYSYECLSGVNS